jgi:hypothetical protein
MSSGRFVHVLLFQCPTCRQPITTSQPSTAQNTEDIDAAKFAISCECGWNGASPAVQAKRHWVAPWESP